MSEAALPLATASPTFTERLRDTVRHAVAAGPDWTAIVQTALAHGTAGLLADRLLDTAPDLLPAELVQALQAYADHCRTEASRHVAELQALLDALAAGGIAVLPFKGPAFACLAYADPGLRGCRDLDLLIAPKDIEATFAVLARLGFQSQYPQLRPTLRRAYHHYNGQDMVLARDRLPVEPHWTFAPRSLAVSLDTAPLFSRARPVRLGDRDVLTLAPEDALLVAGLHGSKEQWARLIWIADLAGLLACHPDLDTEAVLARATEAGLRRMLLIGAALATDLLAAPCPRPLAAALDADPTSRRLAGQVAARLWQRDAAVPSVFTLTAFRWRMRERLVDRLRYAAATLLAARVPHYRVVDLPDSLHGFYPLVRLGHDFVALPLWRAYQKIMP